jgi:hypothetical protein
LLRMLASSKVLQGNIQSSYGWVSNCALR